MRARRRSSRAGLALCLVGAGAMIAGSFLPFLPDVAGYRTPDGRLSIGAGIVVAMLSLFSSRATSRLPASLAGLVALAALTAGLVDVLGAGAPGVGLFAVAGGALLAAAGASASMPRAVRRHAGEGR